MGKKSAEGNRKPGIMLRMPEELLRSLEQVAAANAEASVQDLLLRAARALVSYHHATLALHPDAKETIPLNMEIRQRILAPTEVEQALAATQSWLESAPGSALIISRGADGTLKTKPFAGVTNVPADLAQQTIISQLSRSSPPAKEGSAAANREKRK